MTTQLENFQATLDHQPPDAILFYADFTPDLHKRLIEHVGTSDVWDHYKMFNPVWLNDILKDQIPKLDFSKYWEGQTLPEGTVINSNGAAKVPSGFYHFTGKISPLRNATTLKELEDYPIADVSNIDFTPARALIEKEHAAGRVTRAIVGHMYELAWEIRGYEEFLIDLLDQPAWAQCLLERICQKNLKTAEAFAKIGADLFICGDDVANQRALMFDANLWRTMMLSRWQKVWRRIKEINSQAKIWYHSDGNIIDIVPDLIEAGVDILNPLQPECMDLDGIHRRFGHKVCFDGCIGTQSTMPFGSPLDVKARVCEVIEKYGKNGGLIVSPTHVLEPEVPIANIDAFCAACQEYGVLA